MTIKDFLFLSIFFSSELILVRTIKRRSIETQRAAIEQSAARQSKLGGKYFRVFLGTGAGEKSWYALGFCLCSECMWMGQRSVGWAWTTWNNYVFGSADERKINDLPDVAPRLSFSPPNATKVQPNIRRHISAFWTTNESAESAQCELRSPKEKNAPNSERRRIGRQRMLFTVYHVSFKWFSFSHSSPSAFLVPIHPKKIVTHKKYFRHPEKKEWRAFVTLQRAEKVDEKVYAQRRRERENNKYATTIKGAKKKKKRTYETFSEQKDWTLSFSSCRSCCLVSARRVCGKIHSSSLLRLCALSSRCLADVSGDRMEKRAEDGEKKNASAITRSHLIDEKNVTELLKFDLHVEPNAKGLSIYYYDECSERDHIFLS